MYNAAKTLEHRIAALGKVEAPKAFAEFVSGKVKHWSSIIHTL